MVKSTAEDARSLPTSPGESRRFDFLPAEWKIQRIGDLFDIQQGKALSPKARHGKSPQPFLRTANVFWGRLDLTIVDQMDFTEEEVERLNLKRGDLLVCEGGDIGRTAFWEGQIQPCLYQNHLHRLRVKGGNIEPAFFMFWMQAALTQLGLYAGEGNKTTIPNLSKGRLSAFPVPVPPLPEQVAIACVLRTVQRAKEATEKVIAATRQLKQSLMRHLFTYGPVSFDQAEQIPLIETSIGNVPAKWGIANLGSVAELTSGGTPSKAQPEFWTGTIPWASPKDLKLPRLHDTEDHISGSGLAQGSRLVPPGTLFVVVRGMILSRDVPVAMAMVPMAFNQDMKAIVAGPNLIADYLLYALNASKGSLAPQIGTSAHGTRRISTSALESLQVPLPTIFEQREIAAYLSALDAKVAAEESRKSAIESLFGSLLNGLMTGQIRLAGFASGGGR